MNDTNTLKQQILRANTAYRDGVPVMTDAAFDELCEQYKASVSQAEWDEFRNSLHEAAGKIKHPYIMGSLDKIKGDDVNAFSLFLKNYASWPPDNRKALHVSAKVDGISCRLHYENGELKGAYTRGDGYFGQDITSKVSLLQSVPKNLPSGFSGDIRGELVIFKKDFEEISDKFANPRNATAGIMNKKDIDKNDISHVSFVAYAVLGDRYFKIDQFRLLKQFGFACSKEEMLNSVYLSSHSPDEVCEYLRKLLDNWLNSDEVPYEIDGLVISHPNYVNENKYRPDGQIAFKANQQKAVTKLADIEWQGPSKDGRFVPVAILEPVQIAGTTVTKASLHNADFVLNCENLKYGATVVVCKRGDIIPQIDEVLPE